MDGDFMKEKPIFPLILSMALPMVLSMLVNSLYNIVDSFFIAKISTDAMTALSLVYPIQNFIHAVGIGFGIGMNAVIVSYLGAGNRSQANTAAAQGILFAVIHGIIMTVGCIAIMPVFLRLFVSSEKVINLGLRYSVIAFLFTPIITLGITFEKLFQAVGSMKVTMISMMCGCAANIILDPVLIFRLKMGVDGAALATGIGQILTFVIYLVTYFTRPVCIHVTRRNFTFNKEIILKLYSIGIPATLNLALASVLVSSLNAILAAYSETDIFILGFIINCKLFFIFPPMVLFRECAL